MANIGEPQRVHEVVPEQEPVPIHVEPTIDVPELEPEVVRDDY